MPSRHPIPPIERLAITHIQKKLAAVNLRLPGIDQTITFGLGRTSPDGKSLEATFSRRALILRYIEMHRAELEKELETATA